MRVESAASIAGRTPWRELPAELKANVVARLPLHEIDRDRIVFGTRTTSGRVALDASLGHLQTLDPLAATAIGMTGEHRAPFLRLASAARDAGALPHVDASTANDLRDPAFFEIAVKHACSHAGMLEKLTTAWALLPKDARRKTEPTLRESIESKPRLLKTFERYIASFERIDATDGSSEALDSLARTTHEIADPALRAEEHVALRRAANGDPTVLESLARRTKQIKNPALRAHEHSELRLAANGNPDVLRPFANRTHRIADPARRAQEHVALRLAANGNPTVLRYLAHRTNRIADPARRAQEHVALRQAASGDRKVLKPLANRTDRIADPVTRAQEHVALRLAAVDDAGTLRCLAWNTDRIADRALRARERVAIRRAARGKPDVLAGLPWPWYANRITDRVLALRAWRTSSSADLRPDAEQQGRGCFG